ncbi:Queuine tRNA-ribosyltransferase accessory subunit 2, partial [Ameca splendens]
LHDTVLYCSLHDPAAPCPTGHTTNKTVSVWGSGGRIELKVDKFMALQKTVQPDWYQSMADGETWQTSTSRKRVRKSVDRTLAHLDECLTVHQKSQELDGVGVFGVVEGGDILEERVRSARETAKRPVAGFCLDGFQTGAMDQALRSQLITAVTKELPEDKPRWDTDRYLIPVLYIPKKSNKSLRWTKNNLVKIVKLTQYIKQQKMGGLSLSRLIRFQCVHSVCSCLLHLF